MVIIPPEAVWGPIQEIRRRYDRHYRRWMPHISLLYPFRPTRAFVRLIPRLMETCRNLAPFEVRLDRLDIFTSRSMATLYLAPEPAEAVQTLHAALLEKTPECDDLDRFDGGFSPHLSVGQIDLDKADALRSQMQSAWQPLSFTVSGVCLIQRGLPPRDVFTVAHRLHLGDQ